MEEEDKTLKLEPVRDLVWIPAEIIQ